MSRDQRYLKLASHVAEWSKDPSTKVGAVIVGGDRREIALGYNGFPPGIDDTPERLAHKETKYAMTQHAERNVLDNARFDLAGATLYVTMYPCNECAKSIVAKGIKRVVCPPPLDREPWRTSSNGSPFNVPHCVRIESLSRNPATSWHGVTCPGRHNICPVHLQMFSGAVGKGISCLEPATTAFVA